MKNACANSLAAFLSWWEHGSLVRGAISGLQVIDCYPCPMVGIGKSKPGFVNGFWVWGPNWKIGSRWNSFWDSRNRFLSYLHLRRVELVGPRRNRAPRLPRQTRTDREKVQETESWLLGKSLTWVSSEVSKMPCGKARLTTSPNSTAKAISHMVGEHIFVGSNNLWVSRVEVFAALYGAFGTKCIGHRVCPASAVWYTLSWVEAAFNWYGAIVFPIGF